MHVISQVEIANKNSSDGGGSGQSNKVRIKYEVDKISANVMAQSMLYLLCVMPDRIKV